MAAVAIDRDKGKSEFHGNYNTFVLFFAKTGRPTYRQILSRFTKTMAKVNKTLIMSNRLCWQELSFNSRQNKPYFLYKHSWLSQANLALFGNV